MAEKDISEKLLEDYNDVFADIVNVLLFDGEQVVDPDDLVESKNDSYYKADDSKLHGQDRDVSKYWTKKNVKLSLIGLENQTSSDPDMPMRIMGYDGMAYRSQLLKENKGQKRYPVITLVLYFGMDRWTKPTTLKSMFHDIDEWSKWNEYVNDYRLNLFEIAYLSEKKVNMFQSDFRIVADYFVQMRKNKKYVPDKQTIKHVQEILYFLNVFSGDRKFDNAFIPVDKQKGEISMYSVIGEAEKRGRISGIKSTANVCKNLNIPFEQAVHQIAINFEITEEEASKAVKESYESACNCV